MTIVRVEEADAAAAGKLKLDFKIPYADAFAAALTRSFSQTGIKLQPAQLVTVDFDFKSIPEDVLKVEFLPSK